MTKEADNALFEPVRSDRSFEIVMQRIREKLASGALRPGDKLPPERELAKQLDVSRNVVREALRSLENSGMLKTRKGAHGGAFIEEGSASLISQALSDLVILNAISLDDLLEARLLMLGMVLDRVAAQPNPPDLTALAANLAETEEVVAKNESAKRVPLARAFYHEVAALTANRALVFTIDAQTEMIQTYLRFRVADMDSAKLVQSRRDFLQHLRDGRFDAAKAELSAHLERVHHRLWSA
ncbi:FadR/GntR family transcriptional regulator [Pararhodobacter zhoushanensis]|uniref:GntR family transcriptional regulator n=1 Tax=Pararhodobacter zhoushanensis TaxID=2479545 RepID=A0ABT3H5C3_9RHOB|nr:GntR family transcriptional regulator [Pararhodobacter zhoushanensis]MCW1935002.1 GntR family transcriptional regulator [Pararhodobacter zhoushanensis]